MRYSKIEITGGIPDSSYWYATPELYQSDKLNRLDDRPIYTSDDGLLFYITDRFYRFILIPESHPIFNIPHFNVSAIAAISNTQNVVKSRQKLSNMISDTYTKPLYAHAVKIWREKITKMKV